MQQLYLIKATMHFTQSASTIIATLKPDMLVSGAFPLTCHVALQELETDKEDLQQLVTSSDVSLQQAQANAEKLKAQLKVRHTCKSQVAFRAMSEPA